MGRAFRRSAALAASRIPWAAASGLAALALMAGPAAAQEAASGARNPDPWESANRKSYSVNRGLDRAVVRPIARSYKAIAPRPLRAGLHNALNNLGEPLTVLNDVLELRPKLAVRATARFVTNSTVGVLGLFDVASRYGIAYHTADFGTTLARYGVPSGPYLFVPVLGPSSVRDLTGRTVDLFADPVALIRFHGDRTFLWTRVGLLVVDTRANVDPELRELERTATDPYVTLRSLYLQNREAQLSGGQVDVQALPSFGPEPDASPTPQTAAPSPSPSQP